MIHPRSCREVVSLLSDYRERALPWNQQIFVRRHLRRCPGCLHFNEELGLLGSLVQRFDTPLSPELEAVGEQALAFALAGIRERRSPQVRQTPVPESLQSLLSGAVDAPLRLMALAHTALNSGAVPVREPFLPESVLAQLPPFREWKWRASAGGLRKALLWHEGSGPKLSLVFMPPDFALAPHVHLGTESLLVLEGELEQGEACLTNGDWAHMEYGTLHSPRAFHRGCWCLVREEGTLRYQARQPRMRERA